MSWAIPWAAWSPGASPQTTPSASIGSCWWTPGFLSLDPRWRHRVTGPLRTLPWTSPSILPTLMRDVLRSGPVRMARATAEVMRKDWGHKLPSITAPTLVLWGEHDRICNPRIGRQIAAAVPGARLVIIRGAGHNPMWEKQADFDREVLGFLRGEAQI